MATRFRNSSISALFCLLLLASAVLTASRPSFSAQAQFAVSGAVAQPTHWTSARLQKVFAGQIHAISYTLKGASHTAHVVPLLAVIDWSRPRINSHIKHHSLQFVVEVVGSDGYAADFSLAEISPEIGNRKVWIALDQDGKPLGSDEGPVEIISPQDVRPARWVHGVSEIDIADTAH